MYNGVDVVVVVVVVVVLVKTNASKNKHSHSPQFHLKHDPSFHMVIQDKLDSQWQNRAGFIKIEPSEAKKPKTKAKSSKRKSTNK